MENKQTGTLYCPNDTGHTLAYTLEMKSDVISFTAGQTSIMIEQIEGMLCVEILDRETWECERYSVSPGYLEHLQ